MNQFSLPPLNTFQMKKKESDFQKASGDGLAISLSFHPIGDAYLIESTQ